MPQVYYFPCSYTPHHLWTSSWLKWWFKIPGMCKNKRPKFANMPTNEGSKFFLGRSYSVWVLTISFGRKLMDVWEKTSSLLSKRSDNLRQKMRRKMQDLQPIKLPWISRATRCEDMIHYHVHYQVQNPICMVQMSHKLSTQEQFSIFQKPNQIWLAGCQNQAKKHKGLKRYIAPFRQVCMKTQSRRFSSPFHVMSFVLSQGDGPS